jgi:hypothetical protein
VARSYRLQCVTNKQRIKVEAETCMWGNTSKATHNIPAKINDPIGLTTTFYSFNGLLNLLLMHLFRPGIPA